MSKFYSHRRMIIGEFSRYSSGQAMWQLKNNYKHMKEAMNYSIAEFCPSERQVLPNYQTGNMGIMN